MRVRLAVTVVLSEHHLEALTSMDPQQQAEFLLERAINHYQGATDELVARAPSWLGRVKSTPRLESLFRMAINSDDMRVRVAAIEVNVSSRGLARTEDTIDRLESSAREGEQGLRQRALGHRPARQPRDSAGPRVCHHRRQLARSQRERSLLGRRRPGLPRHRSRDRAAARCPS